MTPTASSLSGRTALVTGSTSGIGAATARALAAAGARVVVSGRDAERGAPVVADCGPDAVFVRGDLGGTAAQVRAFAAEALAAAGGTIDVLVNNAAHCPPVTTEQLTDDDLDLALAVNVRAPHVLVAALVPAMAERGWGAVVNLGSWMASTGMPLVGLYAASKAAEEQLTRSWAAEFGPRGVRVNAVSPGVVRTPVDGAEPDQLDALTAPTPYGRPGLPEQVAAAVLWLVGDDAAFVHGAVLHVDGGISATGSTGPDPRRTVRP